jgi:hypothetical protein
MPLNLDKIEGLKKVGSNWVGRCPKCFEQGSDINGKNHLFIAADGRYGCAVDRSPEHSREIWRLAGEGSSGLPDFTPRQDPPPDIERIWPKSLLDKLIKDHSYWVKRGIPESVIASFQGGIATEGQMKNRYVFPIFNEDGEIHGFSGRCVMTMTEAERKQFKRPKYKHLGAVDKWVCADTEEIRSTRRAILVEGIGCSLALATRGHTQALILFGINMSEAVLGKLIELDPTDIVIALNNDRKTHAAGQKAAAKVKEVLSNFFLPEVARVILPPAKDFLDIENEEQWVEWENQLNRITETT